MIDAVIYYSCSGNSELTARTMAQRLNFELYGIKDAPYEKYNTLAVVFPVHCQGAPATVKNFLKKVNAEKYVFVATYGKASPGNALYEVSEYARGRVTAAAYLPAAHTYNCERPSVQALPDCFYEAIGKKFVKIPRRLKAPFAGVLPAWRSRRIIKIVKNGDCNNCGVCSKTCPNSAIENGKANGKCIRCLMCVKSCPRGALYAKKGFILNKYLKKPRYVKTITYI